jgi:hypothetical protein
VTHKGDLEPQFYAAFFAKRKEIFAHFPYENALETGVEIVYNVDPQPRAYECGSMLTPST